jgi:hypothetical protein
MTTPPAYCLSKADECEFRAAEEPDEERAEAWLQMAVGWRAAAFVPANEE